MDSTLRAYRFRTGNGWWPWVTAVVGSSFLLGVIVVGMAWPSRAPVLSPLSAAVGVLVIVAGTARLHFGPVFWYRVQRSEKAMVLTSDAGESIEVDEPRRNTASMWWGPLASLCFAISSVLLYRFHDAEWPLFGAIAVIGVADAWLYPPDRRPAYTVRVRLDGRPRRLFVVVNRGPRGES
ncbi:MAG: hypothetical protein K6V73_11370 [Firmicutes bacterium]|nr:hypothetical protein [Bacillota bacterium]